MVALWFREAWKRTSCHWQRSTHLAQRMLQREISMYEYMVDISNNRPKCNAFEQFVHQSDTENHEPIIMMAGRLFFFLPCEYILCRVNLLWFMIADQFSLYQCNFCRDVWHLIFTCTQHTKSNLIQRRFLFGVDIFLYWIIVSLFT